MANKDDLHNLLKSVGDSLDSDFVEERVTYVDDPDDPQVRNKVTEQHTAVRDVIKRHLDTIAMHIDNVGIKPKGETV